MYCPMKENGFVSNITVRGVLKGEWTKSQVPFIERENCLHGVQYVRTEHLKTTAVILNLTVCFVTMWSSLTLVCHTLVRVTGKVRASFTVLCFLDPQLLTLRMSGSKYLLNIFELSSLIQDLLCLAGIMPRPPGGKQSSQAENINPEVHVAQSSDGTCKRTRYSWL